MLAACSPCASPSPSSRLASGSSRPTWRATASCSTRPGRPARGWSCSPSSGLTGYQLQDLAADVAMRLDDPRLTSLARRTRGLSAIVSFVEESGDHRLFIAAALLEDGEIRHVHRKVFLPTYGLFDERRFFAPGDQLRAVSSRLGVGVGLAVCEDFWHLATPQVLAIDGAQLLVNVSSSPGRDLASTNEVGLGTASSWRTLLRTYAQLTTSFVVFCNRVGVDESVSFWGGSEVIAPNGAAVFSRSAVRRGAVLRRHRPRGRPPGAHLAAAAPRRAAGAGRPRVAPPDRRAGRARSTIPAPRTAPRTGSTSPWSRPRPGPTDDRRRPVRAARRARDRHGRGAARDRRVHPRPAAPGRVRAGGPRAVGRDRLRAGRVPRGRGDRPRAAADAC